MISRQHAVADLGEGDGGDRPTLQEKIFDFSQQKRTKMNFNHLKRFLKNDFCRSSPLPSKKSPDPSKILDPPLTAAGGTFCGMKRGMYACCQWRI